MKPEQATRYRTERDPLGEKRVPDDVLYGVQTLRALESFQISKLRIEHSLITAIAEIKKAAALAHLELDDIDEPIGKAIVESAGEIIEGQWRDQFSLDVFQAGAGTSYNMNVNEVIANRALEKLGRRRGDYEVVEPNDHVNKGQSTNDVMPTAVELSKIANDLRLMNSGPHTGLDEIELPALQPGSSIMPGKVNPGVAEMLNMVSFHVLGHHSAVTHCAQAGQLELNVMMPYVAYALLESLEIMRNAVTTFDEKCVRLIKPHPEKMREYAERSVGVAALYNEERGFMGAAELAKKAIDTGKSVEEVVAEE